MLTVVPFHQEVKLENSFHQEVKHQNFQTINGCGPCGASIHYDVVSKYCGMYVVYLFR